MAKRAPAATEITEVKVNSVRLSFLWTQTLPSLLEKGTPADSEFAFLTRGYQYQDKFKAALLSGSSAAGFQVPWMAEKKQQFWMRYLVQGKLNEVGAGQAWEMLVPLRTSVDVRLQADWFKGTSFVDAFYYPFGLGLAITFRWGPDQFLEQMVPQAYLFRKNGKFGLKPGLPQDLSLEQVADAILTSLRKRALGEGSSAGLPLPDPFSILTVIQATGGQPEADVTLDKKIMKFLEVMTNWPAAPQFLQLPSPADVCLRKKRSAPVGSVLYAQERGRAVWFPALFRGETDGSTLEAAEQSRRSSKLACYHRNLLFGSLQTEAMGRLVHYTAQLFAAGKKPINLPGFHRTVAKNAALQLAKLYVGDKADTWRSDSPHRQIKDAFFQHLNTVLATFGESPLP
jgi:hypothetical protein